MSVWMTRRKAGRFVLAVVLMGVIGVGLVAAARPLLANYHERQAATALEKQRYPQALSSYQRAIHYRPDSARLYLLARTARRSGNFPLAREYLQKCRELQAGVSEEQQVEGYLLRAQNGEVDEVASYLTPYLIQEGPLTPVVLEGLARAYMGKYRSDVAWGCLARWNELEPNNVEALFRRGLWHAQQQNTRAAAVDFARALEIDPERIDIRLTHAEVIRADKKFTDVAEQYQLVLRQSPQNPDALIGLAQAYVELGRLADAREQLAAVPADKREGAEYLWISGLVELRSDRPGPPSPYSGAAGPRPRNLDACYN